MRIAERAERTRDDVDDGARCRTRGCLRSDGIRLGMASREGLVLSRQASGISKGPSWSEGVRAPPEREHQVGVGGRLSAGARAGLRHSALRCLEAPRAGGNGDPQDAHCSSPRRPPQYRRKGIGGFASAEREAEKAKGAEQTKPEETESAKPDEDARGNALSKPEETGPDA
jgi:hypothetical protein